MRRFFLFLSFLPALASAQSLKQSGRSVQELVPAGWTTVSARGDLNKDGRDDLAVIATPDFPENMKTRDDGYVYNFNEPVLAIYFGRSDGSFGLWRQYEHALAYQTDEHLWVDNGLSITDRGTLRISTSTFASAGGWDTGATSYTFRYQDGDFFLIGKDIDTMSRATGEADNESYNYLTHKCKLTKTNAFKQGAKPKVAWRDIPAEPLERLGSDRLEH
ncbi:MAG: FG-GAP repeat protein [Alloprevotella sp.]|nr:FG-GAP repeat protein [Alloprevotella sp.]